MTKKATISIVQFTPKWLDKPANYAAIEQLLAGVESDVIVLPELCATGYSFLDKSEVVAQADSAEAFAAFLLPIAMRKKAVIVAGFAEKNGENVYNAALIALPDNRFEVYRKTHLFYKEKLCFQEGNSGFKVVTHPFFDLKIGIMVCYDWRFPESARTLALAGADLIVCPSNLVTTVWEIGMKARALENSVFVAVANRCGTETRTLEDGSLQNLSFTGQSALYDTMGAEILKANAENNCVLTAEIEVEKSRNKAFNAFNNIFADRRPAFYQLGNKPD
jgi:predicted amidohydrolase